MKHRRTANELAELLHEQHSLLNDSLASFENGKDYHAKEISVRLRTLAHETRNSASLLGQCAPCFEPQFEILHRELDELLANSTLYIGYQVPPLRLDTPDHLLPPTLIATSKVDAWWNELCFTLTSLEKRTWTRREVVLYMANKDGGSHVDPNLPPKYVSAANAIEWQRLGQPVQNHFYLAVNESGVLMSKALNRYIARITTDQQESC